MFRRVSMLRCADKPTLMTLIKELRFRTDAPIADCSAALKATEGDLEKAGEWLRKKGIAKAVKKGGRVTEHGLLISAVSQDVNFGTAAVLSLCSETDFAARNSRFGAVALEVRQAWLDLMTATNGQILTSKDVALQELQSKTSDVIASAISVLGENLTIRSVTPFEFQSAPAATATPQQQQRLIGTYVHNTIVENVGGIVGLVAVQRKPDAPSDASLPPMEDIARHFVANSGDAGNYVHQSMLGGDGETVGQWLKKQHVSFVSSMVMEFGKEPIVRFAPVIPPRPGQ